MFQTLGACLPGVSLPVSIQQTLQRRASNCQAGCDHDDGDDSHDDGGDDHDDGDESHNADDDRYVLANCRANLVVVEDQKQLAKILEVVVILISIIIVISTVRCSYNRCIQRSIPSQSHI